MAGYGSITVAASVAANSSYSPASLTVVIIVAPAQQLIQFGIADGNFTTPALNATYLTPYGAKDLPGDYYQYYSPTATAFPDGPLTGSPWTWNATTPTSSNTGMTAGNTTGWTAPVTSYISATSYTITIAGVPYPLTPPPTSGIQMAFLQGNSIAQTPYLMPGSYALGFYAAGRYNNANTPLQVLINGSAVTIYSINSTLAASSVGTSVTLRQPGSTTTTATSNNSNCFYSIASPGSSSPLSGGPAGGQNTDYYVAVFTVSTAGTTAIAFSGGSNGIFITGALTPTPDHSSRGTFMAVNGPFLHQGVLEMHPKGYGFLRSPAKGYAPQASDAYVPGTADLQVQPPRRLADRR